MSKSSAKRGQVNVDKLTPDQMADIDLQDALKKMPVQQVKTKVDLKKFFKDEDK